LQTKLVCGLLWFINNARIKSNIATQMRNKSPWMRKEGKKMFCISIEKVTNASKEKHLVCERKPMSEHTKTKHNPCPGLWKPRPGECSPPQP
jgi:hypothetical protein